MGPFVFPVLMGWVDITKIITNLLYNHHIRYYKNKSETEVILQCFLQTIPSPKIPYITAVDSST